MTFQLTTRDDRRHQSSHYPPTLSCDFPGCDRAFWREDLRIRHRQAHLPPLCCPITDCQESFEDQLSLEQHYHLSHGSLRFSCTIPGCQAILSTRDLLEQHQLRPHLPPSLNFNSVRDKNTFLPQAQRSTTSQIFQESIVQTSAQSTSPGNNPFNAAEPNELTHPLSTASRDTGQGQKFTWTPQFKRMNPTYLLPEASSLPKHLGVPSTQPPDQLRKASKTTQTVYSDDDNITAGSLDRFIENFVTRLSDGIGLKSLDKNAIQVVIAQLPGLLKQYAIKASYKAESQVCRDAMFLIYKYRGLIGHAYSQPA